MDFTCNQVTRVRQLFAVNFDFIQEITEKLVANLPKFIAVKQRMDFVDGLVISMSKKFVVTPSLTQDFIMEHVANLPKLKKYQLTALALIVVVKKWVGQLELHLQEISA